MNYVVHPGEVFAIVGESGSGKTVTSMALLGRSMFGDHGSVKLHGREVLGMPETSCTGFAAAGSP